MNAISKVRAIAVPAPSPLGKPEPQEGLGPDGRVSTIAGADINLSEIMRAERIIDIHWDRHLDRFSIVLADYSSGQGVSVGEALADARRRAA